MATPLQTSQGGPTVTVNALRVGTLTLPAPLFLTPSSADQRITKSSLSFLIQHTSATGTTTRMLFDLGIRRITSEYPAAIQTHLLSRQPLSTDPDVVQSLARGGLTADDIDVVVLSYVHWDHIGRPADFAEAHFVVGHGTRALLDRGDTEAAASKAAARVSHAHFEPDLLPQNRTIELCPAIPGAPAAPHHHIHQSFPLLLSSATWQPLPLSLLFPPPAIDLFGDQTTYLVHAPGHLPGHINLLARTGPKSWIYLAGDACHDRSLLCGDTQIATWTHEGQTCCIHGDKVEAEQTLRGIRELEVRGVGMVEVILAHDGDWYAAEENRARFFGGEG